MKKLITCAFLALFALHGSAQDMLNEQEELDLIMMKVKEFSESVMNADLAAIGEAYTENAKIFPNNTDIIEGRDAIMQQWTLPEGVRIIQHHLEPLEIKVIGDVAYDHGYYEGVTRKANEEEEAWRGKYVVVWKKVDGDWKIYLDIWNNIKENSE